MAANGCDLLRLIFGQVNFYDYINYLPFLLSVINPVDDTKHMPLSPGGTPPLMSVSYFLMGANGY